MGLSLITFMLYGVVMAGGALFCASSSCLRATSPSVSSSTPKDNAQFCATERRSEYSKHT
eukprot:scaffold1012_cov418-Prasinococcus_capsulatus_cf.AAC.6